MRATPDRKGFGGEGDKITAGHTIPFGCMWRLKFAEQ